MNTLPRIVHENIVRVFYYCLIQFVAYSNFTMYFNKKRDWERFVTVVIALSYFPIFILKQETKFTCCYLIKEIHFFDNILLKC